MHSQAEATPTPQGAPEREIVLPPLPESRLRRKLTGTVYSSDAMQAYARTAILADRESGLRARAAQGEAVRQVPDAVWEAMQRMIEDGMQRGPAGREDALCVARHRDRVRLLAAPAPLVAVAEPVARIMVPAIDTAEMKRDALEIFDGPETSQDVRDAIEWCVSYVSVWCDKLASPPQVAQAPAQPAEPLTADQIIEEWSRPCYPQDIHIASAFELGVRFAERFHNISAAPAGEDHSLDGIQDEVTLTRAVSVMNDVLEDIAGWEDKELEDAVKSSKVDLMAMIECIRMNADDTYVPGSKPIDGETFGAAPAAGEGETR